MYKILIYSLVVLFFTACKNPASDSPEDPKQKKEETTHTDPDAVKTYTITNDTDEDDILSLKLFAAPQDLHHEPDSCEPYFVKANQCVYLSADQFNSLQVVLDDEFVCGNRSSSCIPKNHKALDTSWDWVPWSNFEFKPDTKPFEGLSDDDSSNGQQKTNSKQKTKTDVVKNNDGTICTPLVQCPSVVKKTE